MGFIYFIFTALTIIKKKIPKRLAFAMGNEGRKPKKCLENQATLTTLSPFIPHPPLNLAMHHKNASNFLWWYFIPKTRLLAKKIDQKLINKGPRALALILAFIAFSKA